MPATDEPREIKFRRVISEEDFDKKLDFCKRILNGGSKLMLVVMFRIREIGHPEWAERLLNLLAHELQEVAAIEKQIFMTGLQMKMLLAPKNKSLRKSSGVLEKLGAEEPFSTEISLNHYGAPMHAMNTFYKKVKEGAALLDKGVTLKATWAIKYRPESETSIRTKFMAYAEFLEGSGHQVGNVHFEPEISWVIIAPNKKK